MRPCLECGHTVHQHHRPPLGMDADGQGCYAAVCIDPQVNGWDRCHCPCWVRPKLKWLRPNPPKVAR